MGTLAISEREIRRHGPGHALTTCWRQWWTERRLARRGIHFRATALADVAAAYRSMTEAEFNDINSRQDWANWRTIPRALNGHVPDRRLRVLDLGCGTGSSTQVLAWYLPAGSHITGYELAEPLLEFAKRRDYRNRAGESPNVDFVCQGVTETLRQPGGSAIPTSSVDVVSASGVVGHHLNVETVPSLIVVLRRVLRAGGIAMLDVGPSLGGSELRGQMEAAAFQFLTHCKSGWWDPTGQLVFRARLDG
jgi:SAM-dependent methyltransferase